MSKKLKWGIISTARINRRVIPPLLTASRSEVVGVASRTAAAARKFAKKFELPRTFDSYGALLESPEIDAVYIPLPNQLHREWVVKAARAGKHILCEKPLAVSVKGAGEMIEAARENKVVLIEALAYRMHPQFKELKELVASGLVGKIKLIRAHQSFNLPQGKENIRWRKEMGGGCLWDLGCYLVSFARSLAEDEPIEVFAHQEMGATDVDVLFTGQLKFISGLYAQIYCGYCLPYCVGAEVIGEKGRIYIPNPWQPDVDGKRNGLIHVAPDDTETIYPTETIDPYLCEVETMEEAVLDGVPPPYPAEESRGNTITLAALSKSAQTGRRVAVSK